MPSANCFTATIGSLTMPSVRANTLVEPPGSTRARCSYRRHGGDLVEGTVAAEADDHVDAAPCGVLGEAGGVAATVGLDHLDIVAAAELALDDDGVARRDGAGEGVHHEKDPQADDASATGHVAEEAAGDCPVGSVRY